jgi:hypothetical protein
MSVRDLISPAPRKILSLPLAVALIRAFTGSLCAAEQPPLFLPSRDVSVIYVVTWSDKPGVQERMSWSAGQRLERVDGPWSTIIFDRQAKEIVLLNPATRAYSVLDGVPRWAIEPQPRSRVTRGANFVIAGLRCISWSWMDDDEERHVACVTHDGVVLRLIIDGQTKLEALSVIYGPQSPELFDIPPGYAQPIDSPLGPKLIR